jgi:hypothetical protein
MPLLAAKGRGIIATETIMFKVGGPLRLRLQADKISPPPSNLQQYNIAQMVIIQFSLECNGAKRDANS